MPQLQFAPTVIDTSQTIAMAERTQHSQHGMNQSTGKANKDGPSSVPLQQTGSTGRGSKIKNLFMKLGGHGHGSKGSKVASIVLNALCVRSVDAVLVRRSQLEAWLS